MGCSDTKKKWIHLHMAVVLCQSGEVYYANETGGPIRRQDINCNNI